MLELRADGHLLRFPAVWLRDNCPCADCLDPVSGQKLKDITELPDGLAVSTAEDAGDDGHRDLRSGRAPVGLLPALAGRARPQR